MTSPQQTLPLAAAAAAAVQLLLPLLSLIYSVAVHIFLSSFNERSLLRFQHWNPIITRVVLFCFCATFASFASSASRGHDDDDYDGGNQSNATILSTQLVYIATIIIATLSTRLILQTRQIEINGPPPPVTANLQDKVIFITGANSGIGLETTRLFYHQYNATVILACRSRARAIEAIQSIDPSWKECRHANHNSSSGGGDIRLSNRMYFLPLDLTSIQSIHTAVKIFLEEMKMPLHVLINNAGVMLNERMETVDGLEMTMAVNHLGHFLLTNLLLPKLRETAMNDEHPTKVITVSSSLYTNAVRPRSSSNNNNNDTTKWNDEPGIDLLDLQCQNKPYRLFVQYAQSKLANILFARELGKREKLLHDGLVQSHVLHPGLVRTNVTRNMPWHLYYPNLAFSLFMMMLQKSPQCGAYTTVYCAVTDEESDDSCYFVTSKKQPLEEVALSDEEGRALWKLSCRLMSSPLEKES